MFGNRGRNGAGNGKRHKLGELDVVVVAMGIGVGFVVLAIEYERISVHGSNASLFDDALCDIDVDCQHFLSFAPTTITVAITVALAIAVAIAAPLTCPGSR
jgi:hypothetical protein